MKRKLLIAATAANALLGVGLMALAIWAFTEHVMIGVLAGTAGAVFTLFSAGCGAVALVMMRQVDQAQRSLALLRAEQNALTGERG